MNNKNSNLKKPKIEITLMNQKNDGTDTGKYFQVQQKRAIDSRMKIGRKNRSKQAQ